MPPVFEQPAPVRGFAAATGGGVDRQLYAQLAGILQDRYAADADRQLRSQLGFAQLAEQRAASQNEFTLGAARLQLQPILQEQQARLEIDSWVMKQQFTQQDQTELNRQNTVLSELMDKRAKGDISDPEFYAQAREVAPRVNVLQAKEQHTRNAAMNEERKMRAAAFGELTEQRQRMNAYQEQELAGQIDYFVPPQYASKVSEIMADAHPEVKSGTPEYDALSKGVANEMGWAMPFAKDAKGNPIYQKDLPGFAGGGSLGAKGEGGELGGRGRGAVSSKDVGDMVNEFFKAQGKTPSPDEWDAQFDRMKNKLGGQDQQKKTVEEYQTRISASEVNEQKLMERADLSDAEKRAGSGVLQEWRRIRLKYPAGAPIPSAVTKRLNNLMTQYERMIQAVGTRQAYTGKRFVIGDDGKMTEVRGPASTPSAQPPAQPSVTSGAARRAAIGNALAEGKSLREALGETGFPLTSEDLRSGFGLREFLGID